MQLYQKYLLKKYKGPFFAAIFCVACEAFCDLLGPTLMARIINYGTQEGQLSNVLYWGLRMLFVTAIGAGFAITRNVLASRVSQRMGADLRYDLFEKIINVSEASADAIEAGSLITRMTNDTSQVMQFVNGIMRIFFKAPITCIGSIVLATMINFKLSIIIYGVVAVIGLVIVFSMKWSYPRFASLQKSIDRLNSVVQEYLGGIRLVKAFGTYDQETKRFGSANDTLYRQGVSSQMIITFASPIITLTVGIGVTLAIRYGSLLFTRQQILPGDISAFTIYMSQMLNAFLMLTNIFNTFVRTKASAARINEVFALEDDYPSDAAEEDVSLTDSYPPENRKKDSKEATPHCRGGQRSPSAPFSPTEPLVRFDHVTFTYPNGSGIPAIENLSFSAMPGQSLAIIGPTGSGKSTICWLLVRFYDASDGAIYIDGKDIRTLPVDTVRSNVAIVPQKPMLFSGTIAENIRWGNPSAPDDSLEEAAEKAQATFIGQMPNAFQSRLESAGVNLSGGQRQRVSIARGLIKQSPILLLDDATSALDAITEAKVRASLQQSKENQTIITITQRCTTAMFSDIILVMENGRAVGFGSHAELLDHCETYSEIYRSQVDSRMEGSAWRIGG